MRDKQKSNGLVSLAIAGSYVVLIGWSMSREDIRSRKILGFSIQRTRKSDGEVTWLGGMKTFGSVEPDPAPGVLVSSYKHPLQTFQWSDYSTEPNETYEYKVIARAGTPAKLKDDASVTHTVTCERVDLGRHAIFFNRGAIASQEYARRFQNRKPPEVGQAAYDWLSRGLIESLERFIDQAQSGDALNGAFFEFKNKEIYSRLKKAKARGVKIKILYDGNSQRSSNEKALQGSGITSFTKPRTNTPGYAHNKFLVWSVGGKAKEVWTGSTNLSENGIFGHSNNAHLLRDPKVADAYLQYWTMLWGDPVPKASAAGATGLSPEPPKFSKDAAYLFSPRTSLSAIDWYAKLAGGAERALFMTFAFGMNKRFVPVYERKDKVIRFALMEKKGTGSSFKKQAEEIDRIRKLPNTTIAVGARIEINEFDRWLAEISTGVEDAHVLYIHTKYMLIDPLGDEPMVVVGSANFSDASTTKNDENMLVVTGTPAVADVYLGEFMRLFSHYAFRESLQFKGAISDANAQERKHLIEDVGWVDRGYFTDGADRQLRRLYFSGQ